MKKFEEVAMNENNSKWEKAIKRERKLYSHENELSNIRSEFDRDYTRIINSNAYKRLKHKTQVFFSPNNDHICTRIEHVNLVESISHTIANYLGLNLELTRAIAVSHDLGHSPFGHQGEKVLSEISQREYDEKFWHEKNGLHFVDNIELLVDFQNKKRNLDLTYAVRDGIVSHCGEVDENSIFPRTEAINLKNYTMPNEYAPYTWEGCVVKIADKISYIGRDIEDAKKLNIINDKEIKKINDYIERIILNNSNIINYLVGDLCKNSAPEKGLNFSKEVLEMMNRIKEFNYKNIYFNEKLSPANRYFKIVINEIFYCLKSQFDGKNTIRNLKKMGKYYHMLSEEFIDWLLRYSAIQDRIESEYDNKIIYNIENEKDYSRAIVDYISGMTDKYIVQVYDEIVSF